MSDTDADDDDDGAYYVVPEEAIQYLPREWQEAIYARAEDGRSLGRRRQGAETALATIDVLLPRDGPEAHQGKAGRLSFQGGYGRVPLIGHANDRLRRHLCQASPQRERQRLRSRRPDRGVAQHP